MKRAAAEQSKAWSERSRGQYLGLYPYSTLGTLGERNFVVTADFSDAARPQGLGRDVPLAGNLSP